MKSKIPFVLFTIIIILIILALINPKVRLEANFQAFLAFVALIIISIHFRKNRLSDLSYILLFFYFVILALGMKYTYSRMPFTENLGFERNHFDRIAHFSLGFFPVIAIREMLIRNIKVKRKGMIFILSVAVVMTFASLWEIMEAAGSVVYGDAPDKFMGMQGDVLDSEWDMLSALLGAVSGYFLFRRIHDRNLL